MNQLHQQRPALASIRRHMLANAWPLSAPPSILEPSQDRLVLQQDRAIQKELSHQQLLRTAKAMVAVAVTLFTLLRASAPVGSGLAQCRNTSVAMMSGCSGPNFAS